MKAKIHPNYFEDQKITCACGNVIIAGSTRKDLRTEICSACHPFYTGHQKLLDTAGRVDKFLARVKKAQKIKEKQVKGVDDELEEILHHEPKVLPDEPVQTSIETGEVDEDIIPPKEAAKPVVKAEKKVAKPAAKAPAKAVTKTPAKAAKAPAKKAAAKKPAPKKAK
jgi:large subunit ribosomal protein L31